MKTPFFDSLIDDFGIWQHTDGQKPLPEHGYALDDANRGLLVCLALKKKPAAQVLLSYIVKSQKGSDFYGFATADRQFIDLPSSEDAKGQVVWALGYAISQNFEPDICRQVLAAVTPSLSKMTSLRGPAYALLGAVYFDKALARHLYLQLRRKFEGASDDWFWPDDVLTYANGTVPYALLHYGQVADNPEAIQLGLKVLQFLEADCTTGRQRGPIGYAGWHPRGSQAADNGQQNIDVTAMICAWLAAYQLSHDPEDLRKAQAWGQWFEGDNIAGVKMYDPVTMRAYDGIHLARPDHHDAHGINFHSGAESNICFLLARYMLTSHELV